VLIKFLDGEPSLTYYEHWLNELDGKKSFVCLGDDCPLCEIGDDPRYRVCFDVIDLSGPGDPKAGVWRATPGPAGDLMDGAFEESAVIAVIGRRDLARIADGLPCPADRSS